MADSALRTQLAFWQAGLEGLPIELQYPTDRPRPAHAGGRGDDFVVELGAGLHASLAELARGTGTTLSMVACAALTALLTRLGAGTDIPIGMPAVTDAGQAPGGGAPLAANPVVIRTDSSGDPAFGELLARVRDTSLAAYEHQDVPFRQVVEALAPPRSAGRHPLFQIMLAVSHDDGSVLEPPQAESDHPCAAMDQEKPDLSILIRATTGGDGEPGRLSASVGFAADLFDQASVRRMVGRLVRVLEAVVADPALRLGAIDLLDEQERADLARQGTGPVPNSVFDGANLQEALRRQAARTPNAVAVRCAGASLTYRELDERANRLAHRLIAAGAGPERPVTTFLSRGVDLVVALTAVLKAGSFYVPLHHAAPLERRQSIHLQARARVLLADTTMAERGLPQAESVVRVDDPELAHWPSHDPAVSGHRDQLAYVMYTSGSTGAPKGVAVTHQNVLDLVHDSLFTPGDHDRVLLLTPYEFDPSTYSFWYPLLHGGTTVIAPEADLTVERLARVLQEERITGVNVTAGLFRVMAEERPECFAGVRVVITGGDVVSPVAVRRVLEHCPGLVVRSNYGPTETTLYATSTPWHRAEQVPAPVPIGRPLDGMSAYVLDDALALVPTGMTGELHLAGRGLSRGYLGRPDLTAERFLANPFGPAGSRMYRTGDRVRWTRDGLLDFVGRGDTQVKIRGFRIEPAEVESVLTGFPGVRQVAVIAREDRPGDKRLVAYLVADERFDVAALDDHARRLLPDYMVPSAVVRLDGLPLTANNKVDVRALPAPDLAPRQGRAPRNATEARLCDLLTELLEVEGIGIDDNFFALGGHSLLATRLVSRIRAAFGQELTVRQVFESATAAGLAVLLEQAPPARPALLPSPRPERVPLSAAQFRLWFLNRLQGPSVTYTLPTAVHLRGALDLRALRAALGDVMERHESLRTVIAEHEGMPYQVVLPVERVRPALEAEHVQDLAGALHAAGQVPFRLTRDVPLRARLFATADDEHVLHLVLHHIGSDGQSMRPLMRDLHTAYAARSTGQALRWAPLPVQYVDYALWQRELLGSEQQPESLVSRQLDYWRTALDGAPGELTLPTDRPRPAEATHRGGSVPLDIGPQAHAAMVALARATGTTVFMVLQAAVATLLTRLGAGEDILLGTPVAGRTDAALDDLVGFFVNTLALRTDTSGDPTFRDLLKRTRTVDLAAYEHQDVPFEQVVVALNPDRSLARHPLFQVMLQVNVETIAEGFTLPGLTARTETLETGTTKFDLLFNFTERYGSDAAPEGVQGRLHFAVDLFRPRTAHLLAQRLSGLLSKAVVAPEQRLSQLPLHLGGEREDVLAHARGPEAALGDLLPVRFEQQAARRPAALAVSAHDGALTYAELNERANRLARLLLSRGVGPGCHVGVLLPRGVDLVVAFVAVLKAGAAYLPVDTAFPADRIDFMLHDAHPAVVLTHQRFASGLSGELVLLDGADCSQELRRCSPYDPTDADRPTPLTFDTPAQVVYTSGTTGRPKGVVLPARVLINTSSFLDAAQPGGADARVAQFSAVGFDVAVKEMLHALMFGKTLCVPDDDTSPDPDRLAAWLDRERVTEFFAPDLVITAVLAAACEQGLALEALRHVSQNGEPLQLNERKRAFHSARPDVRLHSTYGPSEAAMVSRLSLPSEVSQWPPSAPLLGRPVSNAKTYLLDERLQPVPVGVVGEVYLGGPQIAHGYVNRPGLTAQRFVACPFEGAGGRMYCTGDLARWTADGQLLFAGRADGQVKIRGIRVEPGELNAVITANPGVAQAATVVREDRPGDKRLVAYAVRAPGGEAVTARSLRAQVAAAVPQALVPSAFVFLDALPLSTNGKLDHRSLPAPHYTVDSASRPAADPREQILCDLFAEVLGLAQVGADDDFFALGGHSMLATQLASRIRRAFDCEFSVRELFQTPTPAELAAQVGAGERTRVALTVRPRPRVVPMSYAQQRLWFISQLEGPSATYNMPVILRITGALDVEALEQAFGDVAERHESLRTVLREAEGQPVQVVLPPAPVTVHRLEADEPELPRLARSATDHAFDLATEPPMRVSLISAGPDRHVLVALFHHIVVDGWSVGVLAGDLSRAYQARLAGAAPQWTPLPVQYADYALWQREVLGSDTDQHSEVSAQLAYWKHQLADLPVELEYPTDRPRAAAASQRGGVVELELDERLHAGLLGLARATGATVSMLAHAALATVLTRLGAGTDIPIGVPVAGRADDALDGLIGFFVNTLVLRIDTSGNPSFEDLLGRVKQASLAAYAHQDVPFERVVEELNPPRSAGRNPLFQITLQVQVEDPAHLVLPGAVVEDFPVNREASRFDLSVQLHAPTGADGQPGPIRAYVRFASDLFTAVSVERLLRRVARVLEAAVANPAVRLQAVDVLEAAEGAELLGQGRGPLPAGRPAGTSLPLAWRRQVERTPDAIAVRCGPTELTYRDLDLRANRLAHRLIAAGAGPNRPVTTLLGRRAELVVALVAVLKAGSYYVPLPQDSSPERRQWMHAQCGARILLTDSTMTEHALPDAATVLRVDAPDLETCPSHDPAVPGHPDQLAHVLYPPGSARPTGVAVTQQDVLGLVDDSVLTPGEHHQILLLPPYESDAATYCLWSPLLHGGTAVIAPTADLSVDQIGELLEDEAISGLALPPTLFALIAEQYPDCLAGITTVVVGGTPSPDIIRRVLDHAPGATVLCAYRPGPAMPFTAAAVCRVGQALPDRTPIGHPLDGVTAYVLDETLALVPVGVAGELYLAGRGLTAGFLNRAELTAQRLVADPFGPPGARMCRTGDRVRWTADGQLEFAANADERLEVGGLRIDPGEIETVLAAFPHVRQAAVGASQEHPGGLRLTGYVVGEEEIDLAALDAHLRRHLPDVMVPEGIVLLDRLPLTAAGDVDHARLPAPAGRPTESATREPATVQEEILCAQFADVLGIEGVKVDDNFFELGGHSLLATHLVSLIRRAFGREVAVREVFEAPTPAALAPRLDGAARARRPLARTERTGPVPMSFAQQRLWFLNQLEGPSPTYNLPLIHRIVGPLDTDALASALGDVVERHEALRTTLHEAGGLPLQTVLPAAPVVVHTMDCSEQELPERLREIVEYAFDLSAQTPLRVSLLRLGADDHVLAVLFHHTGSDGLSLRPFAEDLSTAYQDRLAGRAPRWTPLPVRYSDYTLWQREVLGSEQDPASVAHAQLAFWREQLAGLPSELGYPTDRPRPAVASQRGGSFRVELPTDLHASLADLARRTGTTLTMVAHAALATVLTRLGAGTDIPIGTPAAGRTDAALSGLVGFFINTLVLRIDTSGDPTFEELLARVREASLAAYGNQDIPFERVVEAVNPPRSAASNPLFQVMLQVGSGADSRLRLPGARTEAMSSGTRREKFDLSLNLRSTVDDSGHPGPLQAYVRFALDLFDEATVRAMFDRLARVLAAMAADATTRLSAVDILDRGERQRILEEWNATASTTASDVTSVAGLFEAQVDRTPEAVALVADGQRLSYAQLDARANRLAHLLRAEGAGPESVVGLCLLRGADMVTAVLAVWKAGAAYLPVDPAHPAERVAFLLSDSRATLLVTDTAHAPQSTPDLSVDVPVLVLDEPAVRARLAAAPRSRPKAEPASAGLAYVMYTSGSTGLPKGVAVTHDSLVNYVSSVPQRVGLGRPGGRYALLQAQVTDLGNTVVFGSLATGGQLHVLDADEVTDPLAVARYLTEHQIDYVKAVPSHLAALSSAGTAEILPTTSLVLGGEAAAPTWVREVLAEAGGCAVFNHYGPTEGTIGVATVRLTPDLVDGGTVPIGTPIANTRLYVLDDSLRPVPAGVTGELHLAGAGLARGYIGRPDLTAERFVACPYEQGARMYRTGDLVRWTADGHVVFEGRADDQVKIRGYRVEPGEVRAVAAAVPGVSQAAVVARPDTRGDAQLVAYVVPADGVGADAGELTSRVRQALARRLPAHLVPSAVMALERLPLTSNGKLDRQALPAPGRPAGRGGRRESAGAQEDVLCRLFAEVLGVPGVGPEDNFFDLGGHSLLAIGLVGRISAEFECAVSVRALFEAPTPERLARWLVTGGIGDAFEIVYPIRPTGSRAPLFCLHPGSGLAWVYSGLLRELDPEIPVYGIQSVGLAKHRRRPETLTGMASEYVEHIRSVQPHGPYRLLGWSLGGVLAHEAAVQLQAAGETVSLVVVLDTDMRPDQSLVGTPVPEEFLRYQEGDPVAVAEEIARLAAGGPDGVPVLNVLAGDEQPMIVNALHYHQQMRPRHVPGIYRGDALFVRATVGKRRIVPGAETWGPVVTGHIEEVRIPCSHFQLLDMAPLVGIGQSEAGAPLAMLGQALNKALGSQ
ncbi:amino acid adenylation domain-containing protein [Streptomyces fuscichromogenes]|uniref:amino acid adenylation domain-containing protein n=1 Tax=Streptomyces fuscichromogenes TaxID=1324013 RepID=UPI0038148A50